VTVQQEATQSQHEAAQGINLTDGAADPGQDPRGAPDPAPLWNVLDMTPEGRGIDWYPKLDYPD